MKFFEKAQPIFTIPLQLSVSIITATKTKRLKSDVDNLANLGQGL